VTIDEIIIKALREDIGEGDHTSLSTIPATALGKARLLIKEDGILAGVDIARKVFYHTDDRIVVDQFIQDGTKIKRVMWHSK
jgi:nicotinate-nucleotide pyrophosphorylase (carboxylating)